MAYWPIKRELKPPAPNSCWVDRTGKQVGVLGDRAAYTDLELSPDGKRAAVSIPNQAGKGRDIWLYDVTRGLRTRFTFGAEDTRMPIWSPDGSRVVFDSNRKGHIGLYQRAASGAGTEEVMLEDNLDKAYLSCSPDGRFILYTASGGPSGSHLFILPLFGDRKPHPFLQTPFNETEGQFSADGRWVAYASNESGRYEVYVASFPGTWREVADIDSGRRSSPLAARWQGDFLSRFRTTTTDVCGGERQWLGF